MNGEGDLLIGLDIGGTKVEAMVADRQLTLLADEVVRTDIRTPDHLVASIELAVDRALACAGADRGDVAAMGGGVPGMVDHQSGEVSLAVNLNLRAHPLGAALADHFECPVALENDVRLATVGVYGHFQQHEPERFGRVRHLACLSLGTGVSAGLILNGELYRGARGMAGEVGHIQVNPDGPPCKCGARGCLEGYISGSGIGQMAEAVVAHRGVGGRASILDDQRPVTSRDLYNAARAGDALAQEIADRAGSYIARALYALLLAYDVEILTLGGGIVHAGEAFMAPVMRGIDDLRATLPLAESLFAPDMVVAAPARNMGAWGGIVMASKVMDRGLSGTN